MIFCYEACNDGVVHCTVLETTEDYSWIPSNSIIQRQDQMFDMLRRASPNQSRSAENNFNSIDTLIHSASLTYVL